MAAVIWRSRCCSLCEGHGLQACQGLVRPEGGCRPCIPGCIHPGLPLALLHADRQFEGPADAVP